MKRILLTAVLGVLCATAGAADRAGLAQSRETFDITRDTTALTQRANVLNEVQVGDVVRSGLSKVTVNTTDQGSILINEQSAIEFLGDDAFRILEGAAIFHLPEGTARAVRHEDLVVTTIENPAGGRDHVVLVSATKDGRVQVQSIREAFAVAQKNGDERLATVGDGDLMIFGRNAEGGWSTIDPNQGQPSLFRLAQDTADAAELPPDEEDEEDRRRGWWFWGGAALLAAAAAGGGYLVYDELTDDDGDDDDDGDRIEERPRRPVSPIIRPDDDQYFDDEYVQDEFMWAAN